MGAEGPARGEVTPSHGAVSAGSRGLLGRSWRAESSPGVCKEGAAEGYGHKAVRRYFRKSEVR